MDMIKFGGSGRSKQACLLRRYLTIFLLISLCYVTSLENGGVLYCLCNRFCSTVSEIVSVSMRFCGVVMGH